jgi:hypothetical protein
MPDIIYNILDWQVDVVWIKSQIVCLALRWA